MNIEEQKIFKVIARITAAQELTTFSGWMTLKDARARAKELNNLYEVWIVVAKNEM